MPVTTQLFDKDARGCLTTAQARKHSDLSGVYLGRLLRNKTLDGFKVDREWFIYADSLERFLASPRKSGPRGPRKPAAQ